MSDNDEQFMQRALQLAKQAGAQGEVPVGAVVELNGEIIGEGFNQPIAGNDPSAHAEILALRQACQSVGNYRIPGARLFVTIEPCSMCAGAMVHARIKQLIYAAPEPKAGVAVSQSHFFQQSWLNHHVEVQGGLLQEQAVTLIQDFFRSRR